MRRLSELQYTSRMQGPQDVVEPADVTAGDMMDDDIFGEYAGEPADITPGDMDTSYEDDVFEPADVTPGDAGLYENIILTEANPFRKRRKIREENLGAEFDNTLKISRDDAVKLSRNYGCKWEKSADAWAMYDVDEHVFTYIPREGKLFTDFDTEQVIEMIEDEPHRGYDGFMAEGKNEQKLIDLEHELDKWESVANKSDKEATTKRKELKKEIKALKQKIGLQEKYAVYQKGGSIGEKGKDYDPKVGGDLVKTFDTSEEAKDYAKSMRKHLSPGEKKHYGMTYVVKPLKESSISPRELTDPDSEFYIGDEDDRIMPELSSIGNIRNDDNEYVAIENSLGADAAKFMMDYNNSPKQRMHKHLFNTHEWTADDDQSDWDDQIEYFYGDLHDNFGDDEDWDDDTAREVANTHMYGHPRWDEATYHNELKTALSLYETAQRITQFVEAADSAMKVRNLLVKTLDGKSIRNISTNPYLDTQKQESKMKEFGPLSGPQRGSAEEPIRRNSSGWEKHPDELDYDDDMYDEYDLEEEDFFDDDINPSLQDEEDDIYDDLDDDGDMWMTEYARDFEKQQKEKKSNPSESRYSNEGRTPDEEVERFIVANKDLSEEDLAAKFSEVFPNNDWDDDVAPILDIVLESKSVGTRLLESADVEKILGLVDELVDDGYDIETAKEVVAANFSDMFNADELYEILFDDYDDYDDEYEEDDIF